MTLPARSREGLCHDDRWRVDDMLREQPDLLREDPVRDMDLWRHLFAPDDLVWVGNACRPACEAVSAEWCSGKHLERRCDCDDDGPMPASVSAASGRYPQRTDESQLGLRSSARTIANCRHRDRDDSRRWKQWPRVLDRSKTWQLSGVFEGPLSWWPKQKNRDGASRRVGNSSDPNRLGPRRRSVGGSIGGLCGHRDGRKPTREFTTAVKILVALNCKGGRSSFEIC